MNITRARELQALIVQAIEAAGVFDAVVTLDTANAAPALAAGVPVVIIGPPKITYESATIVNAEWELFTTTGPANDRVRAWTVLDELLEAMREPIDIDTASPAEFSVNQAQIYPAYLLTFTERYLL